MADELPDTTPEESFWWVLEKRGLRFTQEQKTAYYADLLREVKEEADSRNDEVFARVLAALATKRGPRKSQEFVPSDNYRLCRWGGREYRLNKTQAAMVEALHKDWLQCGVGVSVEKLFDKAGLKRDEKRLEHVFRNKKAGKWVTHPAWRDGLIQHVHGGTYRLGVQEHAD
jgi:hypothetical protein